MDEILRALTETQAWRAEGNPTDFKIRRTPGDRAYLFHWYVSDWYVSDGAARVLDAHRIAFRRFLIDCSTAVPDDTPSMLPREKGAE